MSPEKSDHFAWLDDLVKRWPIILLFFSGVGWITRMQFVQTAQAEELHKISKDFPAVAQKLDDLDVKFDAMLEALGYEVKLKAVKRDATNIQSN